MLVFGTPSSVADKTYVDTAVAAATGSAAQKAANLSDVASPAASRANLGLAAVAATGSATDLAAGTVGYARLPVGSTAGSTVADGGDSRLSNARAWSLYSGTAGAGQAPVWSGSGFAPQAVAPGFVQTATKTGAYTAAAGEIVSVDTAGGAFTITGPAGGGPFGVRWVAGTSSPTVAAPAGYTIASAATVTLNLPPASPAAELITWQATGTNYQPSGGFKGQTQLDSRFARRSVPAMAGSTRPGTYDPVRTLYSPTSTALAPFRSLQNSRAVRGSVVNVLCLGDSKTAGYGAGGPAVAWPERLRQALAAGGLTTGGTGTVIPDATDARWTVGSGWTANGGFYASANVSGAAITFTSTVPGTAVDVWYYTNSGGFSVAIDGGTPVSVAAGSAEGYAKYTVSSLNETTHTVTVTTASAQTVYLAAVIVRRTSGIVMNNCALQGLSSGSYTQTLFNTAGGNARAMVPSPDLLIIALGINDLSSNVPVSTYATNMASLPGLYGSPPTLWIAQSNTNRGTADQWAPYVRTVYDIADATGSPLLDLADRWGTLGNTPLQVLPDGTHESAEGHRQVAAVLASILT